MRSTRRAVSLTVAVATATAVLALPTAAEARFTGVGSAALSISADTLAPPTNPTIASKCRGSAGNLNVTASWTPTIKTYATGYVITLSTAGTTSGTTTVNGGSTSSATVSVPKAGVNYTLTIQTTYRQWTSVSATAPGTVLC